MQILEGPKDARPPLRFSPDGRSILIGVRDARTYVVRSLIDVEAPPMTLRCTANPIAVYPNDAPSGEPNVCVVFANGETCSKPIKLGSTQFAHFERHATKNGENIPLPSLLAEWNDYPPEALLLDAETLLVSNLLMVTDGYGAVGDYERTWCLREFHTGTGAELPLMSAPFAIKPIRGLHRIGEDIGFFSAVESAAIRLGMTRPKVDFPAAVTQRPAIPRQVKLRSRVRLDHVPETVRFTEDNRFVLSVPPLRDALIVHSVQPSSESPILVDFANDSIRDVVAFPDSTDVVAALGSGDAVIVDVERGEVLDRWRWGMGALEQLAISPDGTRIAALCSDGVVIWDLERG